MKPNNRRIPAGEFVTISARGKRQIWTAEYHFNGKHCRQTLRTANLRIARQRAARLDRQLADGSFTGQLAKPQHGGKKMFLQTAISEFAAYCETEGLRRKTRVKYRGILNKFAAFAASQNVPHIADVDLPLIDRYRAIQNRLLAEKSMHHEAVTLKLFLKWAKSRKHIAASPLADEHFTAPKQQPRGGPTLEQVNEVLDAAPTRLFPILALLAFSGTRSGEVQRALTSDIDLKNGWFHIVSRPGAETKSGESRKVPIHTRLRAVLETLPKRSSGFFFKAQPSRKYPDGCHHINCKRLNETFLEILKSLDIAAGRDGGFTVHSLRHFFRTFCINAGVPERVVDIWMGHAHDKSMGSVYFKLSDEESQKWMSKVPFGDGKPAADAGEREVSHE